MKFLCPQCGSQEVWSTEITTWMINTGWKRSSSIKAHDGNSEAGCNHCGWHGVRARVQHMHSVYRVINLYTAVQQWAIEHRPGDSKNDEDWDILRDQNGKMLSWPSRELALTEMKRLQESSGEPR